MEIGYISVLFFTSQIQIRLWRHERLIWFSRVWAFNRKRFIGHHKTSCGLNKFSFDFFFFAAARCCCAVEFSVLYFRICPHRNINKFFANASHQRFPCPQLWRVRMLVKWAHRICENNGTEIASVQRQTSTDNLFRFSYSTSSCYFAWLWCCGDMRVRYSIFSLHFLSSSSFAVHALWYAREIWVFFVREIPFCVDPSFLFIPNFFRGSILVIQIFLFFCGFFSVLPL